jgi:hypothetical protein
VGEKKKKIRPEGMNEMRSKTSVLLVVQVSPLFSIISINRVTTAVTIALASIIRTVHIGLFLAMLILSSANI